MKNRKRRKMSSHVGKTSILEARLRRTLSPKGAKVSSHAGKTAILKDPKTRQNIKKPWLSMGTGSAFKRKALRRHCQTKSQHHPKWSKQFQDIK